MLILYPTETVYALGTNAFSEDSLNLLYSLKNRETNKYLSVLVRDLSDITEYAELTEQARLFVNKFMPGPLTLVVKVSDSVPRSLVAPDGTLGFRISSDRMAQSVVVDFMQKYKAPLTCTSANISGKPTLAIVPDILEQFSGKANLIDKTYDGGPRSGTVSTVVKVMDEKIIIIREGAISRSSITSALENLQQY